MTTYEQSLLGRWIADLTPEHNRSLEVTELVFRDDGQLEYIIWAGANPQRLLMKYKAGNGRLYLTHSATTNAIPFEITSTDQLTLKLQRHPCVYKRWPDGHAGVETVGQKFALYDQIKNKWRRCWKLRSPPH